jgi:hypothetical protein
MEEEDAISLLLNAAFLDSTSGDLRRASRPIASELCCLPLAVERAGASILAGLCNVSDYLPMYIQHHQELLAYLLFAGALNYVQAIERQANGWSDSGDEAKIAILILETFAFCYENNVEDIFE